MSNDCVDLSVVIPCFNAARTLRAAVESVSTNHRSEIIIVDDGSTDDSLTVARDLAKNYPYSLVVITQSNAGPAVARNTALRVARGKYLCFLDADDLHVPGFIDRAIRLLNADSTAVCVEGNMQILGGPDGIESWQLRVMESTSPSTIVLRTEIAKRIGGFPVDPAFRGPAGGEDGAFRHELARFGTVLKLDQPFLQYRVGNSTHFKLFIERSRLENGRVVFANRSTEEEDGSLQRAISTYRRGVAQRMLAKILDDIRRDVAAIAAFATASQHRSDATRAGADDHYLLRELAGLWPAAGSVVALSLDAESLRWITDGCTTSGRGNVLTNGSEPPPAIRVLIVNSFRSDLSQFVARIARDGLLLIPAMYSTPLKLDPMQWLSLSPLGSYTLWQRR